MKGKAFGQVPYRRFAPLPRCGEGALEVLELQAPGGKRMAAKAYLAGKRIEVGTALGRTTEDDA